MLAGCGHQEGNHAPESISPTDSTSPTRAVAWIQDYYERINESRTPTGMGEVGPA